MKPLGAWERYDLALKQYSTLKNVLLATVKWLGLYLSGLQMRNLNPVHDHSLMVDVPATTKRVTLS